MASATLAESNGGFAPLVGRLYSIWILDALVEIGYAISVDFIARPKLYLRTTSRMRSLICACPGGRMRAFQTRRSASR
jgi:hypothetical protein